jgi:hypothetical protein
MMRFRYFDRLSGLYRGIGAAAIATVLASGQVLAFETGYFSSPDMSEFLLVSEEDGDGDGDGDGINETRIRHYRNVAGDKVFSMTTKDRLWAWSVESRASSGEVNLDRNYVIRDSDCDGLFDERYSLDEQFHVPDCLK